MTKIMKKIPAFLLAGIIAVAFAFAIGTVTAQEAYATLGGEGTVDNPYEISDYADLKEFASIVNGEHSAIAKNSAACGKLMNDITCDDKAWVQIGIDDWTPYSGHFNGNHKVIRNLSNEEGEHPDANFGGLFGFISGGEVKDVGIVGGKILGYASVGSVAGVVADGGTVTNCYNTGMVSGYDFVGGVVGTIDSDRIVTNCYNTGAVSGNDTVGGVVGNVINDGIVTNCYNTGAVSGNDNVGGVAGYNNGTITNCYFDNNFSVVFNAVGSGSEGDTVKGLATDQMIGITALDNGNMAFSYTGSEQSPWLAKANSKDENGGTYYSYYPHLNGFAYDDSKRAADWPAKLTTSVEWSSEETTYNYNGSAQGPKVTKVTISQKPVKPPEDMTAEWRAKTVDEESGDPMWSNPPYYDEPNTSGVYRLTIKDGDKVIEERAYIILRKEAYGKLNDYTVRYQVQQKTAGGGTKWSEIDPKNIVDPKQYKVVVRLADSTVLEEKGFQIIRPLTITAPTASAITYGQTLKESKLTGGAAEEKGTKVAGTFTWDKPKTVPAVSDSDHTEYDVTFTPADTENYDLHATKVTVTVNKAAITIAADNKSSKCGEALKKLTYKVSGAYVKGDDLGITLSTDAKKDKLGKYAIKVAWNKNPNYTATLKDGTYTVKKSVDKKAAKIALDAGVVAKSSGSKVTASWGAVKGASNYVVYAYYCGKNKCKKIKTVSGKTTSIDITKLSGKKLNPKRSLKFYVVAYKTVNGKKVKLAKSIVAHAPGSKNSKVTNVTGVKVKKAAFTLKKGKTAKIKAKLVLEKKGKKTLDHEKKFRYATSNAKVAKVSKKGKITAVGKGKCTVYVYAVSGVSKKVKVTVK